MAGVQKLEGLMTKVRKAIDIVKSNGGIKGSLATLYKTDELKKGELVGTDKHGNQYFQNNEHFVGRNRWVHYAKHVHLDYDGSQIPPDWHRWLHHTTDTPPSVQPLEEQRWAADKKENRTGSVDRYVPYSSTKPKIQSWVPPKN